MIEYLCPECSEPMSSPVSLVDQVETCPKCGIETTVPRPSSLLRRCFNYSLTLIIIIAALVFYSEKTAPVKHSRKFRPPPPPGLKTSWERVVVANVGTLDIPPTMEVRTKACQEQIMARAQFRGQIPRGDFDIFIQPQGMNNSVIDNNTNYIPSIVIHTRYISSGHFYRLTDQFDLNKIPIKLPTTLDLILNNQLNAEIEGNSKPVLIKLNGMYCVQFTQECRYFDSAPVIINTYVFQNYDRAYFLSIGAFKKGFAIWEDSFKSILNSFRITNVRG